MPNGQSEYFLKSGGDAWYHRNQNVLSATKSAEQDPVLRALIDTDLKFRKVLEIGCSNGWRLHELHTRWGATCHGIEPSADAVTEANRSGQVSVQRGTAEKLPFDDGQFDLVIFGFCLYLCDRSDLFRIASEADRVLQDEGCLIVYDFAPPTPYRNPFQHADGLSSFKMDHAAMFSWHPHYRTLYSRASTHCGKDLPKGVDDTVTATVLKKRIQDAFPLNPYQR